MTLAFTACTMRGGDSTANVQVGDDIPPFYLKTPDGTPVGSDDLKSKGQPYVVAVFATWCPPCKTELQAFEKDIWEPLKDSNIGVYAINYGGESGDEIREYAQQLGVTFDTIVVCTVTGSTHAGMIAGFAALEDAGGRKRKVLGIDASATLDKTRDQVGRIAANTAELIGLGRDLRDDEITVLEGWAGDHYGIPVESTVEAIRTAASLEGLITDPVYEGKSMAGLIDLVKSGEIGKDSNVLYAHLGGQLALNAYSSIFD